MLRWEIRREGSKGPIAWGEAKTERACQKAIDTTLRRDLHMLNPERLVFEIKTAEG